MESVRVQRPDHTLLQPMALVFSAAPSTGLSVEILRALVFVVVVAEVLVLVVRSRSQKSASPMAASAPVVVSMSNHKL